MNAAATPARFLRSQINSVPSPDNTCPDPRKANGNPVKAGRGFEALGGLGNAL
jgi:hypothetical protein